MTSELRHGKWWDLWKNVPLEKVMEGRFTRLLDLPPATFGDQDLTALAAAMTSPPDVPPTPEGTVDAEENSGVTAAYTYLGQFIDHDLTFDPTSHLREALSAEQLKALVDFRSPRLDLDNLYGSGPSDRPYMYAADGAHLLTGTPMSGNPHDPGAIDVPRGPNGRALIGDPRNDENRIVSQLHATMLRFHNAVADTMPGASFDDVRQQVRWHYQWVVINDFLPTVIQHDTLHEVFPHLHHGTSIAADRPQFSIPKLEGHSASHKKLDLMPIEFSVAAYRFGHSMIRPIYRINETVSRRQIFSTSTDPAGDLGGFRPIPQDWAVDWQFFVDLDHGAAAPGATDGDDPLTRVPQHAYKIDTSLVNPLGMLPAAVATDPSSLALRNLQRGSTFELPSGQAVATALDLPVIDNAHLIIGKATTDAADPKQPMVDVAAGFAGNAPLWAYVLSEAQVTSLSAQPTPDNSVPIRLGPVGGHLVAEVFAALLLGDPTSFVSANPGFTPTLQFTHDGSFGLAELINVALGRPV